MYHYYQIIRRVPYSNFVRHTVQYGTFTIFFTPLIALFNTYTMIRLSVLLTLLVATMAALSTTAFAPAPTFSRTAGTLKSALPLLKGNTASCPPYTPLFYTACAMACLSSVFGRLTPCAQDGCCFAFIQSHRVDVDLYFLTV